MASTTPPPAQVPNGELPAAPSPATPSPVAEAPPRAISPAVTFSIVGTFLILLFGALYYARSFFLPLVLAILLTLTLGPAVRYLGRRGIPAPISAITIIALLAAAFIGVSAFLSEPFATMVADAPAITAKIRERFAFLEQPFTMLSNAISQLEDLTKSHDGAAEPERVVVAQSGLLAWAAGTAADIGTTLGATLLLGVFLLASGDSMRQKLVHVIPLLSDKKRSLRVLRDIENEVSRYLLTIGAINAGLGFCVGVGMYFAGMPSPLLWGVGAGLLNFIPFIGPGVGMALVTAVAIVSLPSLAQAAVAPLIYVGLQIIESNFVTPMIVGRRLELNTVAILIFLALTTWMWGIVGTVIGVPLLVVVKVFADNFPTLSALAEFLSGQSTPVTADADDQSTPAA